MVLKAACLIDHGTYRTKTVLSGLTAKLGPAVLETSKHIDGFKDLLTYGACKMYEDAKNDLMFGSENVCRAILSPFTGNKFDPQNLRGRQDRR